jgi:hypothetical protein
MSINVNEAVSVIKRAGAINTRIVQMPNQTIDGLHQIEVQATPGTWQPILIGIKKTMAENIVRDATNRVILG